MGMTYKQRLFVAAYLGDAKGNAVEAARIAGYAWPDKVGSQLLGKTRIRAAIAAQLDRAAMKADEVLARLSEIAGASFRDFLEIKPDGTWKTDLNRARRRGKLGLIKRIKSRREIRESVTVEINDLELLDPLTALALLAKYHGLMAADQESGFDLRDIVEDAEKAAQECRADRKLEEVAADLLGCTEQTAGLSYHLRAAMNDPASLMAQLPGGDTVAQALVKAMIRAGMKGDIQALRLIMERLEGKPAPVEPNSSSVLEALAESDRLAAEFDDEQFNEEFQNDE